MRVDFLAEARAIAGGLEALRADFHRVPEPGNREVRTAARVERELDALGIPHRRRLDTAVTAVLEGALPGPAVALRADMDALPLQEATGAPFASQTPGMMHACGHDVHMTAALGAARLLAAHRDALRGRVVFLFQPDEENDGGARRLIDDGALEGVDAVFGAHVSPDLPLGCVGVRAGRFYAASAMFDVTVTGRSAHGAERERGVDALGAAAEMVGAALALPSELPDERCVVTVGTFAAGRARNILAGEAGFHGIIRALGLSVRAELSRRLSARTAEIAARWGARVDCAIRDGYSGVTNDDAMTRLAAEAAADALGDGAVRWIDTPTMTTEDFGYYLMERPGSFYHIGVGGDEPLHSPRFLPDARALPVAAATHAAVLTRFLETR